MKELEFWCYIAGVISIFPGAFCLGVDYAESEFYKRRKLVAKMKPESKPKAKP